MCAAPGGKTLLLAEGIKSSGFLIANEMSSSRKGRLVQVINDYIPEPIKQRVAVTGYDGSKWHFAEQKIYDKILLDAPCSGERHLVGNPKEFVNWSEKRTKNMAQRQMQLLYAAAMALKVGGRIMYSTCSISPYENDQVVQKTVTKHKNAKLQVVPISDLYGDVLPIGKATELGGWQILPDEDDNWGPIYFCLIERVE
jgi:16S rRNA C967 or C1407 C5-methylase (RsmB/RsmF family)